MAKKAKRTGKGKPSKLIIGSAVGLGVSIIVGVVLIVTLLSNQGKSEFDKMSEDEKRESATAYVEKELNAWRAGRDSEMCSPVIQPILVDFDIVETKASEERDEGFNRDAFEFTVQLTFTTQAGGRPLKLHRYLVSRSIKDGQWEVQPETAYFHMP